MATVTVLTSFDFSAAQEWDWTVTSNTATFISITNGLDRQDFSGNFTYDSAGNVSGTVTGTSFYINGTEQYAVTGMSSSASVLQVFALNSGDTQQTNAYVLQGNDIIRGSAGNDVLLGYAGDDMIYGNGGNDTIDGGTGNNTVVFSGPLASAKISYSAATQKFTVTTASGTDVISNVQTFTFADQSVTAASLLSTAPLTSAQALAEFAGSKLILATLIVDSAANIAANIDGLENLAAAGKISSIALTDTGIATITLAAAQVSSDAAALKTLTGYYSLVETAPATSTSITGLSASLGNSVVFSGNAASYSIASKGDGSSFTITGNGLTDSLTNVQGLQFGDHTLIVAATPGSATVTTGNVTELYSAVFGRLPDLPGLSYYQQELAANPALSLTTLAQNFLQSPEYVNNTAHNYAQSTAGDTSFISDLYQNLLHRAPAAGDAAWYEANIIAPIVGQAVPGTAAYTSALLQAHAVVVTDFSASVEFLTNVQVTAAHPADNAHWLVLI